MVCEEYLYVAFGLELVCQCAFLGGGMSSGGLHNE